MSNKKTNCQTATILLPNEKTPMPNYIQKTNILPYPEVKKILDAATERTLKNSKQKP